MRYLLPLLVIAFAAAPLIAQGNVPSGGSNPHSGNWAKLGPTVEGQRGFTLYGNGIRTNKSGQQELWVKIIPVSQSGFVRRYGLPAGTAYAVQYATVDCAKRSLFLDKTAVFDGSEKALQGRVDGLVPTRRDSVKPGSVGEALYRFVCVETTTLPLKTQ